jgi:hypothetical protein
MLLNVKPAENDLVGRSCFIMLSMLPAYDVRHRVATPGAVACRRI